MLHTSHWEEVGDLGSIRFYPTSGAIILVLDDCAHRASPLINERAIAPRPLSRGWDVKETSARRVLRVEARAFSLLDDFSALLLSKMYTSLICDLYPAATRATPNTSNGIARCSFHTIAIGRSPVWL